MFYKTDIEGNIQSYSDVDFGGAISIVGPLLNSPQSYKVIADTLYLNPQRFNPETVQEFDAKVEKVHLNDTVTFDSKRVALHNRLLKADVRQKIRINKDLEDDLVDLKQVVQFLARGLSSIWDGMAQADKDLNPNKVAFDSFSTLLSTATMRIDLEVDQTVKIGKIMADEVNFATIVKTEYLDKKL